MLNVEMGEESDQEDTTEEFNGVRELLRSEMLQMLKYDAYAHPLDEESEDKKKQKNKSGAFPKLGMLEEADLLAAREVVNNSSSI